MTKNAGRDYVKAMCLWMDKFQGCKEGWPKNYSYEREARIFLLTLRQYTIHEYSLSDLELKVKSYELKESSINISFFNNELVIKHFFDSPNEFRNAVIEALEPIVDTQIKKAACLQSDELLHLTKVH